MVEVSSKTKNPDPAGSSEPAPRDINRARSWLFCVALLPAVLPLIVISHYHMNIIWNDAWDLGDLLVRAHRGTLHFGDFWVLHNEHRMPVPYLIMFVLARLTGWNTYVEVFFGYAMVCVLSLLLAQLLKMVTPDVRGRMWVWQWFLLNVLIFSPIQCENWVFGFAACQNFIPIPCMIAAMVLLHRRGATWPTVLVCGTLIETGSLSLANGLLGWFLILPVLAQADLPNLAGKRTRLIAAWIGMGIVSFIIQFWGYHSHSWDGQYYTATVWHRFQFFFAFLGNTLYFGGSTRIGMFVLVGMALTGIYVFWVVRTVRRWRARDQTFVKRALPWLALGGYAMGGAFLGAWGRAGLGTDQAVATRYTTISLCLLASLVGLMPLAVPTSSEQEHPWPFKHGAFTPIFSVILLIAMALGAVRSSEQYDGSALISHAGMAHLSFIDILFEPFTKMLVAAQEGLRERADALNELGYIHPHLITNSDVRALMAPGADAEEARASSGVVEHGQQMQDGILQILGWAVLRGRRRAADAVLVTCDDEKNVPRLCAIGDTRVMREDIAASLGKEYANAGWFAEFPVTRLPVGSHLIRCWAYDAELQLAYPLAGLNIVTAPQTFDGGKER